MGKFMGVSEGELSMISQEIEESDDKEIPEKIREAYPELSNIADKLVGVIASVGRHAAGIIVADKKHDLAEELGSIEVKDFAFPVSAIAMKEVDSLNYVKLDVLGLDNIGLIIDTCKLANLPFATPQSDYINFQDEKVWKSMAESSVGIFQFEGSDRAGKILKEVYSDTTLNNIKAKLGDDIKYLDLMSLANAAQRPSGASFIEDIMEGKFTSNGHEALDDLLKDTLGNLVYQEQQIKFLTDFCGYTESKADLIRRAIGKKDPETIKEEVPKIRKAFIETMQSQHGDSKEHAEDIANNFMQVFLDAANYSFSKNHSVPYSYIGYISAWLRYYYPLEFLTSGMEIWKNKQSKTNKLIAYGEQLGITVKPPKFRYSKGGYFMNKEENAIYQGTAPLKGNNAMAGDLLYDKFVGRDYDSFTDFLIDLRDRRDLIIDDVKFNLLEVLKSGDLNVIKNIDSSVKFGLMKGVWSPYGDKTLINSFNKWLDKPEQLDLRESIDNLISDGFTEYMANDWVRSEFDNWRFNHFKGKQKWIEIDNAPNVEEYYEKIPVDKAKIIQLIELNFFSEFGGNEKLLKVFNKFDNEYNPSNKTIKNKLAKYQNIVNYEKSLKDTSLSVIDQCACELAYTGRITTVNQEIPKRFGVVTKIYNKGKTRVTFDLYNIHSGVSVTAKVISSVYRNAQFEEGDLIEVKATSLKAKRVIIDGQWQASPTEKEYWIDQLKFIRKNPKLKEDDK